MFKKEESVAVDRGDIRPYLLADQFILTLKDVQIKDHIVYEIQRKPSGKWEIYLRSDKNTNVPICEFGEDLRVKSTNRTKKYPMSSDECSLIKRYIKEVDQFSLTVEGFVSRKCLSCKRPLTTPESIILGYGPECARKYLSEEVHKGGTNNAV